MSPTYDDDYTNKLAGIIPVKAKWNLQTWLEVLLVSFRIGLSLENNSSSVCTAQLRSANKAVLFTWFHTFLEPPPEANTSAHSRWRSTGWSLGAAWRKFSDFELIPLNIHPWPTIFIAKAAITFNNVGSVCHVNLLTNTTTHWSWVSKNHNGWSRTALHMPRNKSWFRG